VPQKILEIIARILMRNKTIFLLVAVLLIAWTSAVCAETVSLHGAASTVDSLITPNKAAVEKKTGYTLIVVKVMPERGLST